MNIHVKYTIGLVIVVALSAGLFLASGWAGPNDDVIAKDKGRWLKYAGFPEKYKRVANANAGQAHDEVSGAGKLYAEAIRRVKANRRTGVLHADGGWNVPLDEAGKYAGLAPQAIKNLCSGAERDKCQLGFTFDRMLANDEDRKAALRLRESILLAQAGALQQMGKETASETLRCVLRVSRHVGSQGNPDALFFQVNIDRNIFDTLKRHIEAGGMVKPGLRKAVKVRHYGPHFCDAILLQAAKLFAAYEGKLANHYTPMFSVEEASGASTISVLKKMRKGYNKIQSESSISEHWWTPPVGERTRLERQVLVDLEMLWSQVMRADLRRTVLRNAIELKNRGISETELERKMSEWFKETGTSGHHELIYQRKKNGKILVRGRNDYDAEFSVLLQAGAVTTHADNDGSAGGPEQ
jgi:hypothetical protein